MPNLYITEFDRSGAEGRGRDAQVAMCPPVAEQKVVFSTSTQSSTLSGSTTLVRVHADAACSILFGTNPTATTSSMRLAADQVEYFCVPANSGLKIAAISN